MKEITYRPNLRKRTRPRSFVVRGNRLTAGERNAGAELADIDCTIPKTRGDCLGGPRPCPYVSCRYNLFLDVSHIGTLKLNFPDVEPDQLEKSCALDCADDGAMTLDAVGLAVNLTRERARQIEVQCFDKAKKALQDSGLNVNDLLSKTPETPHFNNTRTPARRQGERPAAPCTCRCSPRASTLAPVQKRRRRQDRATSSGPMGQFGPPTRTRRSPCPPLFGTGASPNKQTFPQRAFLALATNLNHRTFP